MSTISIYTDEDMHGQVAPQLRRRGFDTLSTPEVGNLELSDEEQLDFAIQNKRAVLSFNRRDFCRMHAEYLTSGRKHYGIIVSTQLPIGEVVKRCLRLLSALTAEEMVNRLEFLSNWK